MTPMRETRVVLWARRCNDLAAIEENLARVGCQVRRVDSFTDLEQVCRGNEADVLVVSCRSAREVLQWMHSAPSSARAFARIPVLTLAAALDVDLYLEAMQLGAFDCAGLPLDRKELARLIGRAAEARFQAMAS
jgi:DNA-binding NtrC family response regulator